MNFVISSRTLLLCRKSGARSVHLLGRAMSQTRRPPKRFAPLDPRKSNGSGAPLLKGIVFDVDGTLWYVLFLAVMELLL